MSWDDLLTAAVGGLVGGSVSAFVTWLWTHRKWERSARAFKTTARYLARLILDPESVGDLREDEKGWLRGFDQILRAESGSYGVTGHDAELRVDRKEEDADE